MACDCSKFEGRKLDLCEGVGHDGRPDPRPEAVAAFRVRHCSGEPVSPPTSVTTKSKTMSLYERFTTFVKTQAKTMISGFADDETIKSRLAICESCPHLKKNHCELCGCKCNGGANFMNKLGHKSSVCPDNPPRWGAAE